MAESLSDQFRIMVCTDTHIGYKENDVVRGEDSMTTFEEILQTAREKSVDFILHGGDLFDENKPSRKTLFNVMRKLREYCMGDGEILFDCVNDNPPIAGGKINYHDASYNVRLPVFCIHGNHDDPGGDSNLAAADLLAGANLINYIGRQENCDTVTVKPVLLVKGDTKLALYGLGNIRDDRINRAFGSGKVQFERPAGEDWFNLLVLHQNRFKGNAGGAPAKSCVNEEMLPSWLNLVIWGHEHDCKIQPEETFHGEYFISQPGSSVATSLSQGEALEKHVGILEIRSGKAFRMLRHKLQTVRPFYIDQLVLKESDVDPTCDADIWTYLTEQVEEMIRQSPGEMLPLIRLKVEHTGYPILANARFGQQFAGRVANPDSILHFHKQVQRIAQQADAGGVGSVGPVSVAAKRDDSVFTFLDVEQLGALPTHDFNIAVDNYSTKEDIGAIQRFVAHTTAKALSESYKVKTVMGRGELMKTLRDQADTIRMLAQVAVKKDEDSAPPPVPSNDGGNSDDEDPQSPQESRKRAAPARTKAAAKPRGRKAAKKDSPIPSPSSSSNLAPAPLLENKQAAQIIVVDEAAAVRPQPVVSQPWLTPVPSASTVFGAASPSADAGGGGAEFMGVPFATPSAQPSSRRMPWGVKK